MTSIGVEECNFAMMICLRVGAEKKIEQNRTVAVKSKTKKKKLLGLYPMV